MKWRTTTITLPDGPHPAIAPEIISASRATDIPAFHVEWFMQRLREGYIRWLNPFNRREQYVSFANARAIVFWSKNPHPMIQFLQELYRRGLAYYFQFTLNDYETERLEPNVPPLAERIETFVELSRLLGRERVIWRSDPLILANGLTVERLLDKVRRVGDRIAPHTTKLVFSFADIAQYPKVRRNLKQAGIAYAEFDRPSMEQAAQGIARMCRERGISAATCAEPIDLSAFGIEHGKCVDDALILKITNNDPAIMRLFGLSQGGTGRLYDKRTGAASSLKDPGQRPECGCVFSKDIGQYDTCPHSCVYCYANTSERTVRMNT